MTAHRVVVVDERDVPASGLLTHALERGGFWATLERERERADVDRSNLRIVIKPDLEAFEVDSPAATDPRLVESLIDTLAERGYTRVDVAGAAGSSILWAENRNITALASLLGYSWVTPEGREYDVRDLSEDLVPGGFAEHGVLAGESLGEAWRDAQFRISVARNKTDERDGYALGLSGLLNVLPRVDKDYHYRSRLPAGDVVSELLATTPVHFALIDATASAHGSGGGRAPKRLDTRCVIASANVLLADLAGALKMGLDPYVSGLAATVFGRVGLPDRYEVRGNLAVHTGWQNVSAMLRESRRLRESLPEVDRLLTPMLQQLDAELFPLKHVTNAKLNPDVSRFFADADDEPAAFWLLVLANHAIGAAGRWLEAYRTLFDKDALRRRSVAIGLEAADYDEETYERMRAELDQLRPLLEGSAQAAPGLRWREVDGATLFEFERRLPIEFDRFVERVDVSRTIQHMNDYIGGAVVPTARDAAGRVVRQLERNVYLPQPNYLVLYDGKCIDVSKIESCRYDDQLHAMHWKTVKSENGSAVYDDGIVTFTGEPGATRIRIFGRQKFTLPPFWQAVDLDLAPNLKATLVTHAYKTFFERTCANFEALVEGRDIRIGRPWHVPADPFDAETLPVERIERIAMDLAERAQALMQTDGATPRPETPTPVRIDEDGFAHFAGAGSGGGQSVDDASVWSRAVAAALGEFLDGLSAAVRRDVELSAERMRGARP